VYYHHPFAFHFLLPCGKEIYRGIRQRSCEKLVFLYRLPAIGTKIRWVFCVFKRHATFLALAFIVLRNGRFRLCRLAIHISTVVQARLFFSKKTEYTHQPSFSPQNSQNLPLAGALQAGQTEGAAGATEGELASLAAISLTDFCFSILNCSSAAR